MRCENLKHKTDGAKFFEKYLSEKRQKMIWMWVALHCAAGAILMGVLGVVV